MQKYRNSFKKEGFITFFSSFLMFYVSFSYQISILPIRVPFAFTSNQTSTPPWAGNLRKHRAALQIYRLYRISINNKRKPIQRLPFIKLAERRTPGAEQGKQRVRWIENQCSREAAWHRRTQGIDTRCRPVPMALHRIHRCGHRCRRLASILEKTTVRARHPQFHHPDSQVSEIKCVPLHCHCCETGSCTPNDDGWPGSCTPAFSVRWKFSRPRFWTVEAPEIQNFWIFVYVFIQKNRKRNEKRLKVRIKNARKCVKSGRFVYKFVYVVCKCL